MRTKLFFPSLRGVHVGHVWWAGTTLHLDAATVGRTARCPLCGRRSRRVRGRYQRTLAVLPCG